MRFKKLSDLIRHEETGKERQKSFSMPFSTISKKIMSAGSTDVEDGSGCMRAVCVI